MSNELMSYAQFMKNKVNEQAEGQIGDEAPAGDSLVPASGEVEGEGEPEPVPTIEELAATVKELTARLDTLEGKGAEGAEGMPGEGMPGEAPTA